MQFGLGTNFSLATPKRNLVRSCSPTLIAAESSQERGKMKRFSAWVTVCLPLTLLAQAPVAHAGAKRFFRKPHPAGAGAELFRLPHQFADGRAAARFARRTVEGRQVGTGGGAGRSREKPDDHGHPPDHRDLKMPKNGHLTEAQIKDLTAWVKDGAVWPEEKVTRRPAVM